MFSLREVNLAIVGLGYVGLPLAVEFGKHRKVIGLISIRLVSMLCVQVMIQL